MNAIYLDPNMIPAQLRGGYSGKKFKAVVCTEVTIRADAGLWSGGSRDTFRFVQLSTGDAIAASDNMSAPWDASRKDQHITLKPGFAVVEHSLFSGKDMGLTFYVHPDEYGLPRAAPEALSGGGAALNAEIAREVLKGTKGPRRDVVLLNAGAALLVAGAAPTVGDGIAMGAEALDTGRAARVLETMVAVSAETAA